MTTACDKPSPARPDRPAAEPAPPRRNAGGGPRFQRLPALRSAAAAVGLTLAMFCIPPLANLLRRPMPAATIRLRPLDRIAPPALPDPAPEPAVEPAADPSPSTQPVELPRTAPPSRPSQTPPRLTLPMPSIGGEVNVSFPLQHPDAPTQPVFPVAEVDTPPRPVRQNPPAYPASARQAGLEGRVDLEFVVTPAGTVRDVVVKESHPGTLFAGAAREAVMQWRFEPARHRGEPVAVRVRVPLQFRLEP